MLESMVSLILKKLQIVTYYLQKNTILINNYQTWEKIL